MATATVIGALASAIGFHLFYHSHKNHAKSSQNGTVSSPRDPFDSSKRKGYFSSLVLRKMDGSDFFSLFLFIYFNFTDTCHGMIILCQLRFCQLRGPKTLIGRSYLFHSCKYPSFWILVCFSLKTCAFGGVNISGGGLFGESRWYNTW